jgi:hypothetical protein
VSQILFAAEIAFRRLHRCMAQKELNLLQLSTATVLILCLPIATASHAATFGTTQVGRILQVGWRFVLG